MAAKSVLISLESHQAMVKECEYKSKLLTEVTAERDALAAQLKHQTERAEMAEVFIENLGLHIDAGADVAKLSALLAQWLDADHGQRLADVRADAGRAGYLQALADVDHRIDGYYGTTDEQDQQAADEYAAKVRGGAV